MSRVTTIGGDTLASRLGDYLRQTTGEERVVAVVGRLSGGWSVDTFRVQVGNEELVLRIAGPDHPMATNAALEARVMARAGAAGVPVPRVVCAEEDPSWFGAPFSVVSFVPGTAPNVWSAGRMRALLSVIGAEEFLRQLVDLALRIQRVPVEPVDGARPSVLGMSVEEYGIAVDVERWLELLNATSRPRPALTLAGRWLAANAPPAGDVVLQHHDFRLGNVLFDEHGRAAAVLDWEFAGAGDALCDVGYAAQPYSLGRLLRTESSLDLHPDPTAWVLRKYAERAPGGADHDRLRYFVALGIFKMAVALVLPADTWWRGDSGQRDAWLELPILSLTDDLIRAIRELP